MIKIIDKYLVKQFLLTVLFALVAFIFIFIIIDLMEKLDDFIDNSVRNEIVLRYYISLVPEIVRLMLPVSVLLSALFTVGKLSNTNEVVALKSSGMSFLRFAAPFVAVTFLISLFAVYFGGYVVPQANKERIYIEQNYLKIGIKRANRNIFFQDAPNRIVKISYYEPKKQIANKISIQEFAKDDMTRLVMRIDAPQMKYDTVKKAWIIFDGSQRIFRGAKDSLILFAKIEIDSLNFKPREVLRKQRKPQEFTLTELQETIEDVKRSGNDATRLEIEFHSRIAFAWASLITLLFGLPISVNRRGSGLALQIGINLLITFVYLAFMQISQAFGKNGALEPFVTAWLANFVFLIGAGINIYKAQKN